MSFLKEFKEDLSQAVNELVSEEAVSEEEVVETENEATEEMADDIINTLDEDVVAGLDLDAISDMMADDFKEESIEEDITDIPDIAAEEQAVIEPDVPQPTVSESVDLQIDEDEVASDEVTEITKGTTINGNIASNGSINVYGKILGDVSCRGKLIVTGSVKGTSHAGEIYANNSKIEGDVKSDGSVKIGNGSVIVGNVYATSAVIGGAVRGDIDVHGPVIVDATAVIQGNIKSRSVQINNGAAIEGFCSQCYADIDYQALFEDTFGN